VSGHSKWATIKHKKGAADAARGKLFAKLLRQVEVAARQGGGDTDANATLRTMVQKARDASVPLDNIDRAIKRGTGDLEGVTYESITYEGYAPAGVAVIIETLSDNRNRTGAEIKNIFTRNGCSLAEPGAVAWQFERKGIVLVEAVSGLGEDDIMLAAIEAGAEDVADVAGTWQITTDAKDTHAVRTALEDSGIAVASSDITLVAQNTIALDESDARKVLRVIDMLEDHDDVQNVYANFDISDAVMEAVAG
jgi:YebC/PmpR family DNA-binding regulatory protein